MGKKYVGVDVHQSSLVVGVRDERGKVLAKTVIATGVDEVCQFFSGLRGTVYVAFEEGTLAQWLYDVVRPLVAGVVVCNPRVNKSLAVGNKFDMRDALELADLLRLGRLQPVYHGEGGLRVLKELVHNYDALLTDRTRVMNRIKALYRGQAIRSTGQDVYRKRDRSQWLAKLMEPGRRQRAEFFYRQLDQLRDLSREAKRAMLAEARRHAAYQIIRRVSVLGPVRAAQILAVVVTPHRFRAKRQFWPYVGLSVVTRTSSDYAIVDGRPQRRKKVIGTRGLNDNYNHRLKYVFKSAALDGIRREPFRSYYLGLLEKGMRPEMARLTLARKLAALTLAIWKSGEPFDAMRLRAA